MTPASICRLTAADIMSTPVRVIPDTWSIKQMLDFMATHRITGAPVANAAGALVGVISATDALRFENLPDDAKAELVRTAMESQYGRLDWPEADLRHLAVHADANCPVSQIMTTRVIGVEPATPVPTVAALLREHGIHRVFVLADGRPVGVISTSNLLDVLIRSCEVAD